MCSLYSNKGSTYAPYDIQYTYGYIWYSSALLKAHSKRVRFYSEKYYRPMSECSAVGEDCRLGGEDEMRRWCRHSTFNRPLLQPSRWISFIALRVRSYNKSYPIHLHICYHYSTVDEVHPHTLRITTILSYVLIYLPVGIVYEYIIIHNKLLRLYTRRHSREREDCNNTDGRERVNKTVVVDSSD
jgi:hypothetical protein